METELPRVFRRSAAISGERFSFHAARMRMKTVEPGELAAMNADAQHETCKLADAAVDVMAYACLVAVMAEGIGAHRVVEARLTAAARAAGCAAEVISSAGALVEGFHQLGVRSTAIVTPYTKQTATQVVDYIESEGVHVHDVINLEVADNLAVGRLDPAQLPDIASGLGTRGVDAVVLSACVQMPSLSAIPDAEKALGLPAVTAATATSWKVLRALGLPAIAEGSGALLRAAA
ncbi:Asp/Glu racemase [Mycobacterium spongiae]|uniref:Asp/Glu racemase n=2 Tax=Mycobacterium spongiae TaxID=886343 RepID=A0A975K491_9MYCO|nr:Asp/Glu racemase [Mycobacterium spongiae]